LFADFSKAFDVIDHNVLLNKFISNNIPEHIIVWSLDFLNGRVHSLLQELSYRKQIARQLRTQYVDGIYDNPVTLKSRLTVNQS